MGLVAKIENAQYKTPFLQFTFLERNKQKNNMNEIEISKGERRARK
jgi:hypothetical protein